MTERGMMAETTRREAFIPYRRADLVELCLDDGRLVGEDAQKFRDFCEILSAYYHVKSQKTLEVLKDSFAPFNPDADTKTRVALAPEQVQEREDRLVEAFENVLQGANYVRLSETDLQRAFAEESLITLNTSVDFNDYEQIVFYYRGDNWKTITQKKWFRKVEREIDNLERIAVLFKFKDAAYFEAKGQNVEDLNFTPGKMYLYIYKDVPRFDLELLFPNVKVTMTLKDRLLFVVPALGAAVPLVLRVLPSIVLIVAAILFFTLGREVAQTVSPGITREAVGNAFALLTLVMSIGVALGGFAAKQYANYKNKRLQFLKNVTDTLFFKNLVTNQAVLYTLIDSAEEEECKEIILVYYHLLTAESALTRLQLDQQIETWMDKRFQTRIDFDIDKTLRNLAAMRAPLNEAADSTAEARHSALLHIDDQSTYRAVSLDEARMVIDYIWDHIFQYAPTSEADITPELAGSGQG